MNAILKKKVGSSQHLGFDIWILPVWMLEWHSGCFVGLWLWDIPWADSQTLFLHILKQLLVFGFFFSPIFFSGSSIISQHFWKWIEEVGGFRRYSSHKIRGHLSATSSLIPCNVKEGLCCINSHKFQLGNQGCLTENCCKRKYFMCVRFYRLPTLPAIQISLESRFWEKISQHCSSL